ncbi:acetate/propionate family kinase [bacterium]|nr:acetate/propionate family kinase [bacterium]
MSDAILVLNAGSSTLKYSAFAAAGGVLAHGHVETGADHEGALRGVLDRCREQLAGHRVVAVGHRVVHGGTEFAAPVRIDDTVLAKLDALVPLAPLHQPHNLAPVRAVSALAPDLPQVACFDTAFHRTQPEVAQRFGLPRRYHDAGVRRYGFHGLSYEYIASVLPRHDAAAAAGRTVVAHLGNGASLCALLGGKSVATTMSFTPADGLLMGTRAGSLDPGVLLYLMRHAGMTADALEHLVNHESGLLGVSGLSGDMRDLLASPDPRAAEAVELFVYRIGRELGSLAAALGGLDALVFTGGIGENAAPVRDRVVRAAAWLGAVRVHVIPTDEERMIADHTRRVLGLA